MHTGSEGLVQIFPWVGSHSFPRFEDEPQTLYVPVEVVTGLQRLKLSACWHVLAPLSPGVHAM
jgi:hypothetical protein